MKHLYTLYIFILTLIFYKTAYSQCSTAVSVSLPYSATLQTTCGQGDNYNSTNTVSCGGSQYMSGEDVLYSFTPSTNGYILITLSSAQTQTGIFLFEGCPTNGICLSYNTSFSTTNSIGLNAVAGTNYTVMVDNWSPPSCISSYDISISAPGKKMPNEQDCSGAIPICTDTYVQPNSYSGTGNVPNEVNPTNSCLPSGEKNSVWYVLQEQTSGNLSFTINPNSSTDDYDWAVFNITNATCDDIFTNPALEISCNSSGIAGSTGANGLSGSQNNAVIPVVKGDMYVIVVINYWPTQSGYTLDFTKSSSLLYDTIGPQLLNVESLPVCHDSTLKIKFTDNVMCNSVSTTDFMLNGPGGPYTIMSVLSDGCDMGADYDKYYSFAISPQISTTGNFYLILTDTIVDMCGNVGKYPDTLAFTVDSLLASSIASPSDCQAATGSITVTASGGSSPYSFVWQPTADTSATVDSLAAGSYIVTVTDENGCTTADTILVQDKNAATIQLTTYQEPSCNGYSDGALGVSVLAGNPTYSYLWSDLQTSSKAINLKADYYYVEVTDGAGCVAVEDTLLLEPDSVVASLDDTLIICSNASATLSVSTTGGTIPYAYSWNNGLGNTSSPTVYPTITTTYTVTVSDANSCSALPVSTVVTFYDPMVVQIDGSNQACENDTLSLETTVSGGKQPYTYNWNNNATDSIMTDYAVSTGLYWVEVTDACADTTVVDSFLVSVLPSPMVDFFADVLAGCEPLPIQLSLDTTISSATYLWEFNEQSATSTLAEPSYTYTTPGIYDVSLSITFANGCTSVTDKTAYIEVYDNPTAGFSYLPAQVSIQNPICDFNDLSQNAVAWEWFIDDSLFSIAQEPNYMFPATGTYTITQVVHNSDGCTDTVFVIIEVIEEISIQFPNGFSPNGDGLNDTFKPLVEGASTDGYSFIVCDRWGAQVFSTTDLNQGWDGRVNGNKIVIGAYSYKVQIKDLQNKSYVYQGLVTLVK